MLPRQPGTKEARYIHLFSADLRAWEAATAAAKATEANDDRMAVLEQQVAELRNELATIKEEFASFRKQFD
jgi:uncharacterized protein YceH (UPF0502 family)